MATPKFDNLAIGLVKKIPTTFKTAFTGGSEMPDSELLTKESIARFINEALLKLFNLKWNEAFQFAQGKPRITLKYFAGLFPELVKLSEDLSGVEYAKVTPHLDMFRVIDGIGKSNQFIKSWDETLFLIAKTGEYAEYTATEADPALIYTQGSIYIFPASITDFTFKVHYIKLPVDPTTGNSLTQNGSYDSPFFPHWDQVIIDLAYEIYMKEAQETA